MDLLPPGVGFFPSDEILVGYYLANKNSEEVQFFNGSDLIRELNLYAYDPFELPYAPSYSFHHQRHWYCFTTKVAEERRHCRTGFWKKKGAVDICGANNVVVGKKSLFIFYVGNSPRNAFQTTWTMYEYALADKPLAPFVVCRVFDCPPGMDLDSEFGALSDVDEGDAAGDDSDHKMNEVNQNLKGPDAAAAEQGDASYFTATEGFSQAKYAALMDTACLYMGNMTPEQLRRAIMEEDFIEIDDFA